MDSTYAMANRPMTSWAPVRLLPEPTPNAWAAASASGLVGVARLRGMAPIQLLDAIAGADVRGASASVAADGCVVAQPLTADHKFSTRLGPSASPPV